MVALLPLIVKVVRLLLLNNKKSEKFLINKCMKNFPRSQLTMNNVITVPKTSVNLSPISRMRFEHSSTEKQIQSVAQSVAFMNTSEASEVIEFIEFKKIVKAKNRAWRDAHPLEKEDSPKVVA